MEIPRVRMFAGPNGSGKSIIKGKVHPRLIGEYINPDEIERHISEQGHLDLHNYLLAVSAIELRAFLHDSSLIQNAGLQATVDTLHCSGGRIDINPEVVNSYLASAISDFLRQELVNARVSFSFETVMSHPDKVEFLEAANRQGYRTYLYYIATDDPEINIDRVAHRVGLGGHDVPQQKIRERYHKSLDLLYRAIRVTRRAYIFENSGSECQWLAEISHGRNIELKMESVPAWFKRAVLDKIPRKDST